MRDAPPHARQMHFLTPLCDQSQFLEMWKFFARKAFLIISHSSMLFESHSLTRIESQTFVGTSLRFVSLPGSILFIASDAFPEWCVIRIADADGGRALDK
jgi:hypothetical protein